MAKKIRRGSTYNLKRRQQWPSAANLHSHTFFRTQTQGEFLSVRRATRANRWRNLIAREVTGNRTLFAELSRMDRRWPCNGGDARSESHPPSADSPSRRSLRVVSSDLLRRPFLQIQGFWSTFPRFQCVVNEPHGPVAVPDFLNSYRSTKVNFSLLATVAFSSISNN